IALSLEGRDGALGSTPQQPPGLNVVRVRNIFRPRIGSEHPDAVRVSLLRLYLEAVVGAVARVLVLTQQLAAVLREGVTRLGPVRRASELIHPSRIGNGHAIQARLPRLKVEIGRASCRERGERAGV